MAEKSIGEIIFFIVFFFILPNTNSLVGWILKIGFLYVSYTGFMDAYTKGRIIDAIINGAIPLIPFTPVLIGKILTLINRRLEKKLEEQKMIEKLLRECERINVYQNE